MIFVKILLAFSIVYLLFCLYLYFFQDRQIFFPVPSSKVFEDIPYENRITLNFNGKSIHGMYSGPIDTKKPVIIYFGGNAEDVFYNYAAFRSELNAQFISFNYRGFAGHEGIPTTNKILEDVEEIFTALRADYSLDPRNTFLVGRSFGAGIAVQLSKGREFAGILLISPFDSMVNIAKRYYGWFPVALLLKHPLDSLAIAKESETPLLILAASNDNIIPVAHSEALFDTWLSANKKMKIIRGVGHNSIHNAESYFLTINAFIDAQSKGLD